MNDIGRRSKDHRMMTNGWLWGGPWLRLIRFDGKKRQDGLLLQPNRPEVTLLGRQYSGRQKAVGEIKYESFVQLMDDGWIVDRG